jgi:hypothetical protein
MYNLGRVFEKKGMWYTALKYYNDSMQENPEYQPAKVAYYKMLSQLN